MAIVSITDAITRCARTTLLSVSLFGSAMLMVVLLARSTTLCPSNGGLVPSCGQQHGRDRPAWLDRSVAPPQLRFALRTAPSPFPHTRRGGMAMIMLGIDAHKRTHTVVAVDELGRRLAAKRPRPPPRRITWS